MPDQRTVLVSFSDPESQAQPGCDQVRGVRREVSRTAPLRPALQALFAGPTAAESASGLGGFGRDTGGLLRGVRVLDGVVYVDLNAAAQAAAA